MAKKASSTLLNMFLSLTIIALVAATALAVLNGVTAEPIAKAQQAKVQTAISKVLPPFSRIDDKTVDGNVCHIAYNEANECVGVAVEAGNDKGFGGHIQLMVGFDTNGLVYGYKILETHETPGLGAKAELWFQKEGKGSIIGKGTAQTQLAVRKDGGEIDAITGSTITSRAFLDIVNTASTTFQNLNI